MEQFASGKVTGTGAAINISLGWNPDFVEVFNLTDTAGLAVTMKWFNGMPAASGVKGMKVVDNATTGNASQAKVTSNGISQYAGDATHAKGFTIGADANLNVAADVMAWRAMRNGPGHQDI